MAARPLPVSACSLAAFTAVLALSTQSHAQTPASPPRPPYQELRYDEDWGFLKDPARRTDPWDALKYISFIRTDHCDPRRLVVPRAGIEPATQGFSIPCSTN